jgi:23S rRNA pseudouridine2605 synthase
MDYEEKKQGETPAEQNQESREAYNTPASGTGNYQREYRPGRSPRPRIHTTPRPYANDRQTYNRNNDDEGGFRPEGFGAGLQQSPQQRQGGYRPRNNNQGGGYGNYQQRPYQQRPNYRPRYNQEGEDSQGYQPRRTYNNPNQEGGYQQPYQRKPYAPKPYGQQQNRGAYQQRPYGQQQNRGAYQQDGGYQQKPYGQKPYGQGGYNKPYGQKPYNKRPRTADYDPNAKYSMKKRIEYKEEHFDPNEPIRLNKFLANAGVCSRREADEFIQAGVVTVNGQVVTELGTKVLRTDEIRFHEDPVTLEKKVYVLLNKPKDYVTTSDDPQQRKTVMDLVKNACPERIYPVGRLDRNTTGVLLLTNDGDLASKLTHPKYLKKKIYHVFLDKNVTAHDMQQIAEGITLDDGDIKADDIQYADPVDKKQVGIEIHSGKNRIVRRIFEALGYKVTKLDRVQFAGLTKKNLRRGDWRYLTEEEVDRLRMGAYE